MVKLVATNLLKMGSPVGLPGMKDGTMSDSRLQTWIDRRLGGEVTAHIDSKGYGFSVKQQPETKTPWKGCSFFLQKRKGLVELWK